jgi:hypothetical protein
MADHRTVVTELVTGLGTLGFDDLETALAARPGEMASLSPEQWDLLDDLHRGGGYRQEFMAAWQNGQAFLEAADGLRGRRPLLIEWRGGQRQPGDEPVPADLRIDHVYLLSCKYLSQIVTNSSPATVFDRLLAGGHGARSADWFAEVAPAPYDALYQATLAFLHPPQPPTAPTPAGPSAAGAAGPTAAPTLPAVGRAVVPNRPGAVPLPTADPPTVPGPAAVVGPPSAAGPLPVAGETVTAVTTDAGTAQAAAASGLADISPAHALQDPAGEPIRVAVAGLAAGPLDPAAAQGGDAEATTATSAGEAGAADGTLMAGGGGAPGLGVAGGELGVGAGADVTSDSGLAAGGRNGWPGSVLELTAEDRGRLQQRLGKGRWAPELRPAALAFSCAVARASAERWRKALDDADLERALWRLLRIGAAPYFVLGASAAGSLRLRIGTAWDWRQHFRLDDFVVTPAEREQPVVDWAVTVTHRRSRQTSVVEGHVEIRWAHGKFAQRPEAKVYLDTPHHLIPGYWPLT